MNCSAMITTTAGYPGKWIPIPCDTNITCSFFCVSEDTSQENITRPFNWFTEVSNQSDTGKAGITTKYQTNGASVLFCPLSAILIKNTCFTFATSSSRYNGSSFKRVCRENNATLLKIIYDDYYDSQITTYYEDSINITYMPLHLKEGMERFLREGLHSDYEYGSYYPSFSYSFIDQPIKTRFLDYERDYGHSLFVSYADKTVSYLLGFIYRRFKTYFSNVSSPIIPMFTISLGGRDICLLLHPDYLKEMPIFHTDKGFSVQGWRLKKVKCSSNHVVDLVVCTVEPSYRELSICPVDYYQCQDKSCILSIYVCDGHQDCDSDEQQTECNQTIQFPTLNCPNSDFWLGNNHSIPAHSVCDGIIQCDDGEDELICRDGNIHQTVNGSHITSVIHQRQLDTKKQDISNAGDIFFSRPCTFTRKTHNDFSNVGNSHLLHCRHVLCPGMFKCRHSYCIDIVAICDGVVDCPESEDESSCLNIYCPGMIKCRSETKCVPTWNICDGHTDCLLNQDDEATCYRCPEYCKCNSYYIECILSGMLLLPINNINVKIMKLILSRETFDFAFLSNYLDLFYLDISTSSARNLMDSANKQNLYITYLLFLNASGNLLHEMYFMSAPRFRFIQIIDLSNNKLAKLFNIPPNLKILYLKNNLIVLILYKNILKNHNLRFLDLRNNPIQIVHFDNIMKRLTSLRYLLTYSTIFCCILPSNVKCSLNAMICKGLCSFKIVNIVFLVISTITFLISIAKTIRCMIALCRNIEYDDKYLMLMIHVSLSDTVICIWAVLTCSLFMVTSHSDRNLWRLSALCNDLGVASFIALQMRMYIQLYHKMFLFVKIVFPLKKESIITNNTNKICLLLWLFSALTSVSLQIIVGKVYIHGDLCFSLFAKDILWGISSWASLFYWAVCCSCVILYLVQILIMCRAIFISSKTLQDENISTKRRKSAIRFSLMNVLLYCWWLVFGSLTYMGQTITIRPLHEDLFVSTLMVHTILHLLVTARK